MENKFEKIKEELKTIFFGIDEQIDQAVKAFETWLSVKDYQVRPMTICLWGLTGTGKTELINKTIDLLGLNKSKVYIKFGSKTNGLDDDFETNEREENIFILDEFQYFRTKSEDGIEIERDENNSTNIVWDLLDSGVVNLYGKWNSYGYERSKLLSSIYILNKLNLIGATINEGIIYHHSLCDYFKTLNIEVNTCSEIEDYKKNHQKPSIYRTVQTEGKKKSQDISKKEVLLNSIIGSNDHDLFEYIQSRDIDYTFQSKHDLIAFINNFNNIEELIEFFKKIINSKPKAEIRNYTKSLIFVIGNVDECFTMSNELNSDLDADYFYKETKKITIIDIRKSLLKRFRSEQIARLGSTHIIYPSLNKNAFKCIIDKELNNFQKIVIEKFNTKVNSVSFSNNIKELIYKEGVFPTIGARSVFSTVNEIISDKFSYIIQLLLTLPEEKQFKIIFDYNKKNSTILLTTYDNDGNTIDNKQFKYEKKIDNLRNEKNKGKQVHRAVHEAGHAVCSIILNHSFPEAIYSVVLDEKKGGFNLLNIDDFYCFRKNNYLNEIATDLAGYVAEEIVFGSENVSNGSSSDINHATTLLSRLYKDCGFFDNIGHFVSGNFVSNMFEDSNYKIVDKNDDISDVIFKKLEEAMQLAKQTLINENELFLRLSEYLCDNPKITNKKLKELTKKYIKTKTMVELSKDQELFYSEMLNEKIKELNK